MGTYVTLVLKNKRKATKINKKLVEKFGDNYDGTFEGVNFGAFYSEEMLKEDIRFVNEDDEGLKQNTNVERPITRDFFLNRGFYVGQYSVKISCPSADEMVRIRAIQKWLKEYGNLGFLDLKKSKNVDKILIMTT